MSTSPSPAPSATVQKQSDDILSVTLVAYPKLLFTWPLILAGFIFATFSGSLNEAALQTLGWVYITILLFVVITLGVDVGRNQAIFWFVLVFAVWILGLYLRDVKDIPLFGYVWGYFQGMNVRYDRGLGLAVSTVLAVPFVLMIIVAWLNDRWRITHNEFEHYSFGKMDDSLGRGAKTIRSEYPDMFELLLAGAGTLIVYNASGNQELRRIPHVVCLPWVRGRLNKILERVAVTTAAKAEDEEEMGV